MRTAIVSIRDLAPGLVLTAERYTFTPEETRRALIEPLIERIEKARTEIANIQAATGEELWHRYQQRHWRR